MEGLILVLIALALIIAEAHLPTFGVLGILGMIALFTGGNMIVEAGGIFGIPVGWDFFIGIGVVAVGYTLISTYIFAKSLKKQTSTGLEGMIGQDATIFEWANQSGKVMVHGELWQAESERTHHFNAGDIVTISGAEELKLRIRQKD